MPRIDLYINSLSKFGATGVVLRSGENVILRFPTGDRFANQTVRHPQLMEIVREVMPRSAGQAVERGEPARFHHDVDGSRYDVTVRPKSGDAWEVEISPGAAVADWPFDDIPLADPSGPKPPPEPRAEPPAPPASPRGEPPPPPHPIGGGPGGGGGKVHDLLVRMKELGASDLHLSSGASPYLRVHGRMQALADIPPCDPDDLLEQLFEIAPEKNRDEFEAKNDTDFAYAIPGTARFRVNMFRDRRGPGAVMRTIPYEILTPEQIGLPKKVLDLCYLSKGLVLVTGPTGSGKSTTLATLIDHINEHRDDHIISIEDPIEFVHENKRCLVNQREVHEHTSSFKGALRAALREDPDVVLVGEMRDLETIAIAVETAETGHLVFGTLHTSTAPSTVDRVIDQFPPDQQEQIRQMLSESLKGVIAQTLLRKKGGGRVAAYEVLIGTSAVSNLIRERKTFQLFSLMQTGRAQGMMTLNDSLLQLVKSGVVEPAEAYVKAVNKAELENLFRREGISIPTRAE
jgi:twitching motility protein PilT